MNLPNDFTAGIDDATGDVFILSPADDDGAQFLCRIPFHAWRLIANVEIPASRVKIEIREIPPAATNAAPVAVTDTGVVMLSPTPVSVAPILPFPGATATFTPDDDDFPGDDLARRLDIE